MTIFELSTVLSTVLMVSNYSIEIFIFDNIRSRHLICYVALIVNEPIVIFLTEYSR